MVRWPDAREAASYARANPDMSVGLHIDLGEWTHEGGDWRLLYQVADQDDAADVEAEIAHQLARFRSLVGADPTQLDSHQHVHRNDPTRTIVARLAQELGVPVREGAGGIRHEGSFYGQGAEGRPFPHGVSVEHLVEIIRALPEGITELGCHPGYDDGLATMYRAERAQEVAALCDPRARTALTEEGITLTSFRGV
jgi:predicted glycoside hydrolase/deacetylase ChbG (UPF0249 family)